MNKKLFILTGPTAVGKTSVAIDLARKLDGEVISADSMQIYKYMDIGTAKVKPDEMKGIPHYLIDIIYPDENFTVSDYKKQAMKCIKKINQGNKLPIVVGGTGLFINSLVYKLNFGNVPPNKAIRSRLETYDNEYLHSKLMEIDEISGEKISIRDRKRIIRALEIWEVSGKIPSSHNNNFRKETDEYDLAMVCLNMDRGRLYQRINDRVDIMIESGLVAEVKNILDMGYDKDMVSMQGIGYKEIIMYLEDKINLDESIDIIKQRSRNYAKRQLTWFKRDNRIKWIDIDNFDSVDEINNSIENYIYQKLR
ncbi:tRNA (adenosine(37)-N6)-dimethylallyltransferase MiaA [Paratissierella segnis]|jgi:tRNA dimethylallyltransferase|uniref:tRNA dimethylallyltransferase n=1 Tax=Paratissierella segnis TaxID=2763679 RepID=A0A926IG60_9FIRM|nr:tRNA (adenosine(37)-N6)-dimethylallyltransferase MiaA [Paratissierella segnis]MBC8589242.1 tRNA (adenosine(37)-N6)-dimethylallyltransferase MiaA [Paratissierella segnis]